MYKDIFGKTRQKVGLHIHTTLSDGDATPEEVYSMYKAAGYDAIALTDHRIYAEAGEVDGLTLISGAEYDTGQADTCCGVYHVLSLFAKRDPEIDCASDGVQTMIDKIHTAGGLAVLAHPAWSLNTPSDIMQYNGFDATEIYNAVSGVVQSFRPDSSLIVDMLAGMGREYPLLATDDAHYFEGRDNCVAYIMAECDNADSESIKNAIISRRFYATQGPEIHLVKDGDVFKVYTSPVSHIYISSNAAWSRRTLHGENITYMEYKPRPFEKYLRAFAIDSDGKTAWSNIISLL